MFDTAPVSEWTLRETVFAAPESTGSIETVILEAVAHSWEVDPADIEAEWVFDTYEVAAVEDEEVPVSAQQLRRPGSSSSQG